MQLIMQSAWQTVRTNKTTINWDKVYSFERKEKYIMTFEMILALSILILMIVLIMTDKMAFGAPPLLACMLLVITGLSTVQEAFYGSAGCSRENKSSWKS